MSKKSFHVSYSYNGLVHNKIVNEDFVKWLSQQLDIIYIDVYEIKEKQYLEENK